MNDERTQTMHLAEDGVHLVVVERWLDRQVSPPRWRSKNRRRKATPDEIARYRDEDVRYELERLVDTCDRVAEDTVRRTLARLPSDVRAFALDQCLFASVGDGARAQTLPPVLRWLVLLGDAETAESVVAHEIAHAWLGHRPPNTDEQETAACYFARSWGFRGVGAAAS